MIITTTVRCDCHKATTCSSLSQLTHINRSGLLVCWSVVCKTGGAGGQVALLGERNEQALPTPSWGTDVHHCSDGTSGADDGDRWRHAWTHNPNAATTAAAGAGADAAAAAAANTTAATAATAAGAGAAAGEPTLKHHAWVCTDYSCPAAAAPPPRNGPVMPFMDVLHPSTVCGCRNDISGD
jgi:hypothetical protein